MPPAIRVENLSKRYRIRHGDGAAYRTLRDEIMHAAGSPLRWLRGERSATTEDFWALQDVSFEVQPGEVVGVIGRNGAGKSTLLKILSRITKPTRGRVEMRGRVGSLLEVGTGFHPELTGRENIFLSGAILGMKRAEIARKFDEIVAFAEIEKFLDTPVKRYSSGMYVRLAFSVAAHLEPDILIIDEVLAVGDAQFQKKCLGKMSDAAQLGRTVLFVSHNMPAVQAFCGYCIWLEQGVVSAIGAATGTVARYLTNASVTSSNDRGEVVGSSNSRLLISKIEIDGEIAIAPLRRCDTFDLTLTLWNGLPNATIDLSLSITNDDGVCVFASTTSQEPNWHGRPMPVGQFESRCTVPSYLLNSGTYRTSVLVVDGNKCIEATYNDVHTFEIQDDAEDRGGWFGKWPGVVRPALNWRTSLFQEPSLTHEVS